MWNGVSCIGHKLFYFDSKKVGEVTFLINGYDNLSVKPIEIKSGNDKNISFPDFLLKHSAILFADKAQRQLLHQ